MTGLLKSLHIEETRRPQRELRLKIIDAPLDEEPAPLAEAICRELAADRPEIEVGWSKGRRRVLRPTLEAVGSFAGSRPPFKETWIVTGGGRGVTVFVALQLARRYGLKLHLIGRSPHPQEHAPWRHYSEQELKRFKASLAQQAITAGRMPDDEWEAVQNDIEIHDTLRKFALAGVEARYHSCDVSDWDAMARLLRPDPRDSWTDSRRVARRGVWKVGPFR